MEWELFLDFSFSNSHLKISPSLKFFSKIDPPGPFALSVDRWWGVRKGEKEWERVVEWERVRKSEKEWERAREGSKVAKNTSSLSHYKGWRVGVGDDDATVMVVIMVIIFIISIREGGKMVDKWKEIRVKRETERMNWKKREKGHEGIFRESRLRYWMWRGRVLVWNNLADVDKIWRKKIIITVKRAVG